MNNNPVRYNDPTGHFINILIGLAVGALVGGIAGGVISYAQTGSVNWNMVGAGALAGGIAGGIIATGVGLLAAPALTTTGLVTAGAELAGGATAAAEVACADGDCTNEVTLVASTANEIAQSLGADGDPTNEITAITNPLANLQYTDKVQTQMSNTGDLYHGFPSAVDSFGAGANVTQLVDNLGRTATKYQIPGSINGVIGNFEYIIGQNGLCNHRLFIPTPEGEIGC